MTRRDASRQIQQPLHQRAAGTVVFTRRDLERGLDAALSASTGSTAALIIAGDIQVPLNDPIQLGKLTKPIEIECVGDGRFISVPGATVITLSGLGDGTGAGGLNNRLTLVNPKVGGHLVDGNINYNTVPDTFISLKSEAKDFYITIIGGDVWTGTASAVGALLAGNASAIVRRSRIEGLSVCRASITANLVRSVVANNNFESAGVITLSASSSYTNVVGNTEVAGIALASGASDNIVSHNTGDRGVTAITAVTSDGNTVVANRKFSAYPTPGGTDVVANNA